LLLLNSNINFFYFISWTLYFYINYLLELTAFEVKEKWMAIKLWCDIPPKPITEKHFCRVGNATRHSSRILRWLPVTNKLQKELEQKPNSDNVAILNQS